ncbi:MAG TPA: DUF397 domain-containing protein [Streptomyces sp.]
MVSGPPGVEVALSWHKSTCSSGSGGSRVEVATCPAGVHIRGSKVEQGPCRRRYRNPL